LTVYAGGGGGYYIMPEFESDVAVPGSGEPDIDPDDEFGFFIVGGAELALSEQVSLFGEAKYTWLEVEELEIDDETIDLDALGLDDIEFTGLGINAGLLLLW
jgi:hypothetical protein